MRPAPHPRNRRIPVRSPLRSPLGPSRRCRRCRAGARSRHPRLCGFDSGERCSESSAAMDSRAMPRPDPAEWPRREGPLPSDQGALSRTTSSPTSMSTSSFTSRISPAALSDTFRGRSYPLRSRAAAGTSGVRPPCSSSMIGSRDRKSSTSLDMLVPCISAYRCARSTDRGSTVMFRLRARCRRALGLGRHRHPRSRPGALGQCADRDARSRVSLPGGTDFACGTLAISGTRIHT
jgi:hypothetical protein